MIRLDEEKLEKVLLEVLNKEYSYAEVYLNLEDINFDVINKKEDNPYRCLVKGSYGWKDHWNRVMEFWIDVDWSWDFIAGYFACYVENKDMESYYISKEGE